MPLGRPGILPAYAGIVQPLVLGGRVQKARKGSALSSDLQ